MSSTGPDSCVAVELWPVEVLVPLLDAVEVGLGDKVDTRDDADKDVKEIVLLPETDVLVTTGTDVTMVVTLAVGVLRPEVVADCETTRMGRARARATMRPRRAMEGKKTKRNE